MDLDQIRDLIDLLIEKDVAEFELESQDTKVKIRREEEPATAGLAADRVPPAEDRAPESEETEVAEAAEAPPEHEDAFNVTSPMVGTFYRAPDPESDPFVEVGDVVEEGDTLCIVEAMKLMNEITSEIRGEVLEVRVENGEPVEYGQDLFVIDPLG